MAKRYQEAHCQISTTAKGMRITLPKSDYLSPLYSRRQLKRNIAELQDALDDDMFTA